MVEFIGLYFSVPIYTVAIYLLGGAISAGLFVFHVVVVPLVFKYSKTFRRHLIFANFVQWPPFMDFEDPSSRGIHGGRNLSIDFQSKVDCCPVKIGIWHILPKTVYERLKGKFSDNMDKEELNKILDDELANSKTPIIFYCHGNSNSRGATHRVQMYKFFQQMDFHTIAFDYRGFGDSTNLYPTEDGVVEDSLIVYEWLVQMVDKGTGPRPPIFMWGHSLGTGISSHLLGNLELLSTDILERSKPLPKPNGLVLESPFNNLADEVANIPISRLVTWLPYHDSMFLKPFRNAREYTFRSDEYLRRARDQPVLILHAKDDFIVPFVVGLKLYRSISESRSPGDATVEIHVFDKKENLGHKWICTSKHLKKVVGKFVESHKKSQA